MTCEMSTVGQSPEVMMNSTERLDATAHCRGLNDVGPIGVL